TQAFTPARYIQSIDVKYNDKQVFNLATDISLASNPVISFDLLPSAAKGTLKVDVKDSQNERWSKDFSVPNISN
ncbi:thiosulfate oxidation carrier complex protein SoxZ, partial [Streptomyces europaeiscabiei]|uniref:thiosulfate oxidation carrier complex protein SoxZ n=1 Tax=Streptomyces europaeiscabiei TaxID=146819 RepID=UPI0038F81F95